MTRKQLQIPSYSYIKKPGPQNEPDGFTEWTRLSAWERRNFDRLYARLPLSVLMDRGLTAGDVRVFAGLAYIGRRKGECEKAFQDIAAVSGCCEHQVHKSLKKLVARGHIEADGRERRVFKIGLTSGIFGGVTREVEQVEKEPAPVYRCGKCGAGMKRATAAGLCRTCVADLDVEQKVRQARAELGQDATWEQIAAALHSKKITARLKRVLGRLEKVA